MTEIERRYGCEDCPLAQISCEGCDSYGKVVGATEQKAIDDDHFREATKKVIDKACEWILRNWWDYGNRHQFVQDFRKAMEE